MSLLDALTKSLLETYNKKLNSQQQEELIACLEVLADDQKYNRLKNYLPDAGEFSRDKYPKHLQFFKAGKSYKERIFLAGNRVGKSLAGCAEAVYHATGLYPDWWTGFRFNCPTLGWIGGDTAATVRDIIQKHLLGELHDKGSGMLPKETIHDLKTRRNVPDAIEIIYVKHISGGISTIVLKTYEQGRVTWQGADVDWIWIDEECPEDVYGEALIRLMNTKGIIFTTFTPLQGLTELVVQFLDNSQETDSEYPVHVTTCGWKEVPHLTEEEKARMLARTPPNLREARANGVPTVGSGLIYPMEQDAYTVSDFPLPRHFKKAYGFDVGWNNTAAVWGAWDKDNDIIYIYSDYKRGGVEGEDMPLIHAEGIKSRGSWIKGTIDPASRGRNQSDGSKLFETYKKHGLKLIPAMNAVEAGILNVWERLSTGKLKIFKSCSATLREMSLYHRDEKGAIVKKNDHCADALRYLLAADYNLWSYQVDDKPRSNVIQMPRLAAHV